jgi:hypothetical protein
VGGGGGGGLEVRNALLRSEQRSLESLKVCASPEGVLSNLV